MNLELDKNDLINVAVAEFEEHLLAQRKKLDTDAKKAKTVMNAAFKKLKEARDNKVQTMFKTPAAAFTKAAKALGFDVETTVSDGNIGGLQHRNAETIAEDKDFEASIGFRSNGRGRYMGTPSTTRTVKKDATIRKAEKNFVKARTALENLQEQIVEVVKQLSEISHVERQKKADIARMILSQTTTGKKILSQLSIKNVNKLLGVKEK